MPAGAIRIEAAPGPQAVVRYTPMKAPRVPSFAKAWSDTFRWTKAALTSAKGWQRAANAGIGGRVLVASAIRGIVSVAPTALAIKATTFLIYRGLPALLRADTPEAKRLHRAVGEFTGAVALVAESALPATATEAADAVRRVAAMPTIAVRFAAWQVGMVRAVGLLAVAGVIRATKFGTSKQVERMTATAGLSVMPRMAGLGGSVDLGGVAVGLPTSAAFTEPQNLMADDPSGGGSSRGLVAMGLAAVAPPGLPPGLVLAALDATIRAAEQSEARVMAALEAQAAQSLVDMQALMASYEAVYGATPDPDRPAQSEMFGPWQQRDAGEQDEIVIRSANDAIVSAPLWGGLVDASATAIAGIEANLGAALTEASKATREWSHDIASSQVNALRPAKLATDSLNDAMALDVEMIQKATEGSARGARIQQVVRMGALAAVAAIRSAVSFSRGVALAVGGDIPEAALQFAASGMYAAAGVLAISYGGAARSSGRRIGQLQEPERLGTVAELMVIVPGYADPARIRDEVAMAIDGTGAVGDGTQGFARSNAGAGSIADQAFATYEAAWGGERGRNQLAGGLAGLYAVGGPLGWTAGVIAGRYGDQIGAEANRVGRRIRRFGRRLGL